MRFAPHKNIYGNAESFRSIHSASWSGLPDLNATLAEDMQHTGDLTAIALALLLLGLLLLGVACATSLVRLCCLLRRFSDVSRHTRLHPEE